MIGKEVKGSLCLTDVRSYEQEISVQIVWMLLRSLKSDIAQKYEVVMDDFPTLIDFLRFKVKILINTK